VRSFMLSARLFALVFAYSVRPCAAAETVAHGAHWTELPGSMPMNCFSGAPGQLPSAAHTRGTVFLARPLDGKGVTLTEWDLALAKVVREAKFGWPETGVQVVRAGDTLHLAVASPRVRYAAVNVETLRIAHQVDLGVGDAPILASDGALSVVSWFQLPNWYAATLDADGRILGRFHRALTPQMGGPRALQLVVLNGHAYVLVGRGDVTHLLKLSPALAVEKDVVHATNDEASLAIVSGHLVVGTNDGFDELSADLDVIGHHRHWSGGDTPLFAADAAGRIVTNYGDVFLNPAQPPVATFPVAYSADDPMPPLWVGNVPVLLHAYSPTRTVGYIEWMDLSAPDSLPPRPTPPP
jgi:hypothetical protein